MAARLAQMVERMTLNHVVAGSIPAVGAQRENATFLSEGRTQAFPWRAPISSFGSGLAGSNWISLPVSVVVAGAYYSLSHCAAATGRLVPGSIPDKRKNLFLPLLLVVAPPTRCGFESRPASNPCVAARLSLKNPLCDRPLASFNTHTVRTLLFT